jgi:hypothetical protein
LTANRRRISGPSFRHYRRRPARGGEAVEARYPSNALRT